MENKKHFYITTTLPYVNATPHIGFALEIIKADAIARYKKQQGFEVFFNTGTDEHGQKIYQTALELNKTPQEYCDELAKVFIQLKQKLNLSFNSFIRTTDEKHIKGAAEFWNLCLKNGYIYKGKYKVKYCVGCELEKQDSDLVDNRCPLHPNLELQINEEENYYFKFSAFQKPLLDLYKNNPKFVLPEFRLREMESFVKNGLQDFSISRLKSKMPWGINVPNDDNHVMYVWFDALINYISCLGFPDTTGDYKKYWPGTQICGKDNLRQQSAMWQAMLMAAGLQNSTQILVEGFINSNGQKMSKSLGNTVDPFELTEKYGIDALRYYLLAEFPAFGDDGDYTFEKFKQRVNGDLANGIGNLVARVTKMCETGGFSLKLKVKREKFEDLEKRLEDLMDDYRIDETLVLFREEVTKLDKEIQLKKPWENLESSKEFLEITLNKILNILNLFSWVLPTTHERVWEELGISEKGDFTGRIKVVTGLFPRIS